MASEGFATVAAFQLATSRRRLVALNRARWLLGAMATRRSAIVAAFQLATRRRGLGALGNVRRLLE